MNENGRLSAVNEIRGRAAGLRAGDAARTRFEDFDDRRT